MGRNSDDVKYNVLLLKKKRKILKSTDYFKIDSPASLPTSSGSFFLCERLRVITESCLNKHVGCELHLNPTAERKKCHLLCSSPQYATNRPHAEHLLCTCAVKKKDRRDHL